MAIGAPGTEEWANALEDRLDVIEGRAMLHLFGKRADVAVVLGSGLGAIEGMLDVRARVPYNEIGSLPTTSVEGHSGVLFLANVSNVPVVFFSGRFHLYEGFSFEEATSPVRLAREIGCRSVILTQAAGSLRKDLPPSNWFLPDDVVSFPALEPEAISAKYHPGERPPRSRSNDAKRRLIDEGLLERLKAAVTNAGAEFYEGTIMWNIGPAYETKREAEVARISGASAVTMSSYPELIAAGRLRMKAALLSWISNYTSNVSLEKTNHRDVLEIGIKGARMLKVVLEGFFES